MTIKGQKKSVVRGFISNRPTTEMRVIFDAPSGTLNIETVTGRGVDLSFHPGNYNDDGDPMTDAEKQDIADALQAIVDEHNATL